MGASDTTATFGIALNDETSGPARDAAAALAQLKDKITQDTRALREMQAAMRQLRAGTVTNVAAMNGLKDKIDAQKQAIAQAQAKYVSLGGTFGRTTQATRQASGGFGDLLGSLERMPGPLGGMLSRLGALRGLVVGGGIAAAIAAIAAASVALVAATIAAAGALLRYGVAQSDARRSELLRMEGLNTLRHWMGRVRASAGEMQAAMDRAAGSTVVGRGQLETYARQLARVGLAGDSLSSALEAMAIAQQVQGDRGAARFRAQVANARITGRSVEALAESYRQRLGPIARRQMMSLTNQSIMLRRSLDRIFSGLRLESFLSAIHQVTQLFSQSTASGRALKTIVESLFQPLLDGVGGAAPILRRFFQGMVIGALLLTIAILKVRRWIRDTFGDSTLFAGLDMAQVALYAGVAVVGLFTAAVLAAATVTGLLAAALGVVVASAALVAAPFLAFAAALAGVFYAGLRLTEWISETDWTGLGTRIIDGLVGGLRSGVARVRDAVRNLASSARAAFESAMDIASPSRVFRGLGEQLSAGVAVGVDDGSGGVQRSVEHMVEPPALQGGALGAGVSVSIGDVHIHAPAGADGRSLAADFVDELVALLEGAGVQIGAPT